MSGENNNQQQPGSEQDGTPGLEGQNVNDLDKETLDSMVINDDGTLQKAPKEPEESDADKGSPSGDGTPEAPEGTPEGKPGEESDDRLSNTQRAFHARSQELATVRAENAELRRQMREMKKPVQPRQYSEAELQELRDEDPDEYVKAVRAMDQYKVDQASYDAEVQKEEAQAAQLAYQTTSLSFLQFVNDDLGIQVDPGIPWDQQPENVKQVFNSPEFAKVRQAIEANPSRFQEQDGSVTYDTFSTLYLRYNKNKVLSGKIRQGRQEAISSINNAAGAGSKLEGAPAGEGPKGGEFRPTASLSQVEINSLGPEALAERLKQELNGETG